MVDSRAVARPLSVLIAAIAWLSKSCGADNFASHSALSLAGNTAAFHFRSITKARTFGASFPDATLVDGTVSSAYELARRKGK